MRDQMDRFIRDCEGRPLLLTYEGDGTPITTHRNVRMTMGDHSVRRSGKAPQEYYVHHCFAATFDGSGKRQSCVLLEDPRPMTDGKKTGGELAFALQLCPSTLRVGSFWHCRVAHGVGSSQV